MRRSFIPRLPTAIALALLALALEPAQLSSTPTLLPSIGLDREARDADSICEIPLVSQDFDAGGPRVGALVPDFTLYRTDGMPATLSSLVATNRPVLLVSGSISCPVFRSTLPSLNAIADRYADRVAILIVYVLEPHPAVDISPYYGVENVTPQNRYADILVRQPRTYGERRALVDSMRARMTVVPQIVVDGPCNEWWSAFGRAPNNAVLIDIGGRVASYHGWFNREPRDMSRDIDSLLGSARAEGFEPGVGRFELRAAGAHDSTAAPGSSFNFYTTVTNTSSSTLRLVVERVASSLPDGWSTATCTDVCQPPSVARDAMVIRPGAWSAIGVHVFTDSTPGVARVTVRLTNADSIANVAEISVVARVAGAIAAAPVLEGSEPIRVVSAGPGALRFERRGARVRTGTLRLFDVTGCLVATRSLDATTRSIVVDGLARGRYFYLASDAERQGGTAFVR